MEVEFFGIKRKKKNLCCFSICCVCLNGRLMKNQCLIVSNICTIFLSGLSGTGWCLFFYCGWGRSESGFYSGFVSVTKWFLALLLKKCVLYYNKGTLYLTFTLTFCSVLDFFSPLTSSFMPQFRFCPVLSLGLI